MADDTTSPNLDVCSADVVLRGEHIEALAAALREAGASGKAVRLFIDTTGVEPTIAVYLGSGTGEYYRDVAQVPVAGVVFE